MPRSLKILIILVFLFKTGLRFLGQFLCPADVLFHTFSLCLRRLFAEEQFQFLLLVVEHLAQMGTFVTKLRTLYGCSILNSRQFLNGMLQFHIFLAGRSQTGIHTLPGFIQVGQLQAEGIAVILPVGEPCRQGRQGINPLIHLAGLAFVVLQLPLQRFSLRLTYLD